LIDVAAFTTFHHMMDTKYYSRQIIKDRDKLTSQLV
jgi:hypothetical protein